MRLDSPEKSDTIGGSATSGSAGSSRSSRALRRGSLDVLPTSKNGSAISSLRSRSCDTVSPVKVHLKRLPLIGELTSNSKALGNECEMDSFELEAVADTKENDDDATKSPPKDETVVEENPKPVATEESQRYRFFLTISKDLFQI